MKKISITDPHAAITKKNGKFTIEKYGNARLLHNGKQIESPVELSHLDRLVFGASQYYAFIDPSKSNGKDNVFTFEMAQDEIAEKRGLISKDNRENMTQGKLN
jgi:hypothetical protein